MDKRIITVRGTGEVSAAPDSTVLTMTLNTLDKDYDRAVSTAAELLEKLREALRGAGFEEKDLKTSNFNVRSEYESIRDENGTYKSAFSGYACTHGLKLEFDFDTDRLSKALKAISGCLADPQLSVRFTVKDRAALEEALLKSAAENAKRKAEVLTKAAGVGLGDLLRIDYDFAELSVYSRTEFCMEDRCMAKGNGAALDFEPEDISLSDSASFTWEIA